MKYLKTMTCALALCGTSGFAAVVDFENEAPLNPDPTFIAVGTSYANGGITFTSTEFMQLVGVGPGTNGFVPNDTPGSTATGPANFGDVFLTGDFKGNTDMNLAFSKDVTSVAFDIVDIDGGNDSTSGENQEEQFTFEAFLGGISQGSQLVTSNDLTGALNEAGVVRISFAGLFDEVQITGVTPGGTRGIGWGIDNIETTPVPVPAAGLMLLSALGGIGLMRRRNKRAN